MELACWKVGGFESTKKALKLSLNAFLLPKKLTWAVLVLLF